MRLTVSKREELEKLIRDWLQKQGIETDGVILDVYLPEQLKINIHTSSKPLKKGRLLDKKLDRRDWKAILDIKNGAYLCNGSIGYFADFVLHTA